MDVAGDYPAEGAENADRPGRRQPSRQAADPATSLMKIYGEILRFVVSC
jgi:hypothetical protein